MIQIKKDCTTCIHEPDPENVISCKYCVDFNLHEFDCDYCVHRLIENYRFCECENDDGSQNCCGDHFEFDNAKFIIQ
jgi:hypothetical protein